ncbi:MAG: hypothetical protein HYY28_01660 [Betaproteobacteria bacterium]|nr:hypothetical protein [Betaproteobacteria bacterium]
MIEQILGSLAAHGIDAQAHMFRTSDGHEIDLVLEIGSNRVALEVKLSASVSPQDMTRLDRAADLIGAEHRYLVCQTAAPAANATRGALTLAGAMTRLERIGDYARGAKRPGRRA